MKPAQSAGRVGCRFGIIVVATTIVACSGVVTRDVLATILSVRGDASWALKDGSQFNPLTLGSTPGSGTILRTGAGEEVDVALMAGALVRTREDTELQIEELTLTKDGNETADAMRERVARVKLNRGSVLALLDPAAHFTIVTPDGRVSVAPGCLLLLQTDKAKTRLTCVRGKIDVTRLDGTNLALDAGYVLEATGSGTAVKPVADDARARVDVADATAAEHELRALQSRRSAQAPFLSTSL